MAHALVRAVSRLLSTRWWGTDSLSSLGVGMSADAWSFYIFSSGGSANELGIVNFDLEFLEKFGVLRHFLA